VVEGGGEGERVEKKRVERLAFKIDKNWERPRRKVKKKDFRSPLQPAQFVFRRTERKIGSYRSVKVGRWCRRKRESRGERMPQLLLVLAG